MNYNCLELKTVGIYLNCGDIFELCLEVLDVINSICAERFQCTHMLIPKHTKIDRYSQWRCRLIVQLHTYCVCGREWDM